MCSFISRTYQHQSKARVIRLFRVVCTYRDVAGMLHETAKYSCHGMYRPRRGPLSTPIKVPSPTGALVLEKYPRRLHMPTNVCARCRTVRAGYTFFVRPRVLVVDYMSRRLAHLLPRGHTVGVQQDFVIYSATETAIADAWTTPFCLCRCAPVTASVQRIAI